MTASAKTRNTYRVLGRTALKIFPISVGTAALGIEYGVKQPGESERPNHKDVERLLLQAADAGINLFDTAPTYGDSEEILGSVLGHRQECLFATKVSVPHQALSRMGKEDLRKIIRISLEKSLRNLRRETLDIVQIHNLTVDLLKQDEVVGTLFEFHQSGNIRFLGATVYTEAEAIAAIQSGYFDVLQVAFNLLDQRMASKVFPLAQTQGVGIISRSAFLKGALTSRVQWFPPELALIQQSVKYLKSRYVSSWDELARLALQFCLSQPAVGTVLVGVQNREELQTALSALQDGSIPKGFLAQASQFALSDERLLNPTYWPVQ